MTEFNSFTHQIILGTRDGISSHFGQSFLVLSATDREMVIILLNAGTAVIKRMLAGVMVVLVNTELLNTI